MIYLYYILVWNLILINQNILNEIIKYFVSKYEIKNVLFLSNENLKRRQ